MPASHSKIIAFLFAVMLSGCFGLGTSRAEKIVVLLSRPLPPYEAAWNGLKNNISGTVERYDMNGDAEKAQTFLTALTPSETILLVAIGTEAADVISKFAPSFPMVYTMVAEKVKRPNAVSSGVLLQLSIQDQLGLIRDLFPDRKRIGVIYDRAYSSETVNIGRTTAEGMGRALNSIAVFDASEVPSALQKLTSKEIDVFWTVLDPTVAIPAVMKKVIDHTLEQRIPLLALNQNHVKWGALAAYGFDYVQIGKQTAALCQDLLREKKSLPLQVPSRVILYLNSKTQEILGVQLPEIKYLEVRRE